MAGMAKRSTLDTKDYKILKEVAESNKFSLQELISVYGLESDYGKNMGAKDAKYKGHFQFDDATAKEYGLKDPFDLKQSAQAHIDLVNKRKSQVSHYLSKYGGNWEGFGNMSNSTFNYLLHNQGAWGTARMSIGKTKDAYLGMDSEGNLLTGSKSHRRNMIRNLTPDQQSYFTNQTKSPGEAIGYFTKSLDQNLEYIRRDAASQIKMSEMKILDNPLGY
tara:strand:+ start:3209 stop:3865 length:657 start_codon:yes stop_codon:yes gene_type:complete